MSTGSLDGTVKVWDIMADGGTNPKEIGSRNMKQGDLYSMNFCQDIPWVLACGGNNGEIAVWDTSANSDIEDHFKPFLAEGTYDPKDYDTNAVEDDDNESFESVKEEARRPENRT